VALAILAMSGAPAGASITLGPTGGGSMSGSVYCNMANHTIGFVYSAVPQYVVNEGGLRSVTSSMSPVAEWVEVYAYVKPSWSSTYGAAVAHGYAYVDRNTIVLNSTIRAYAGQRYDVVFVARAAYPGGQWSGWIRDVPSISTSYSGSVFAASASCTT
jgi:hypothetical protein